MILVLLAALLHAASAVPLPSTCGTPAIAASSGNVLERFVDRIVGGKECVKGSWPWQIQVRYNGGHFCGASLVSNDWIVSAAHCFKGMSASAFSFRAGRHTKSGTNEPNEQSSAAQTIYMHESYNANTMNNDVALIRLRNPFTFTKFVHPICLPSRDLPAGTQCYTTGWGDVKGTCCSTVLKQAMVPVIARSTCQTSAYYGSSVTNGMICAGYEAGGIDSCQGDSGGPLVSLVNGKWELHGATSWGHGCAQKKKPGVYANIFLYKSWITSKIVMAEAEEAAMKFRPIPAGAAFREMQQRLMQEAVVPEPKPAESESEFDSDSDNSAVFQ